MRPMRPGSGGPNGSNREPGTNPGIGARPGWPGIPGPSGDGRNGIPGGLNNIPPPPRPKGSKSPRPMSLSGSIILERNKIDFEKKKR